MSERVLDQFPVSHYCEKARWVLDLKGVPYRINNQLPGFHMRPNRQRTGSSTVPVLREGERAIGGSHAIALHLETLAPSPALVPARAESRAQLESIVDYFDDTVGPAVRRFVYSLILGRPAQFRKVFFGPYGGISRMVGLVSAGPVSRVIAKMYRVNEHSVAESERVVLDAADYVEHTLHGQAYLVDDTFTLADLTVASLLAPLVGSPGCPWDYTLDVPEFSALRARLRARPVGAYVDAIYAGHRKLPG